MLEVGLAIIVACLPALQSLARKTWLIDLLRSIWYLLLGRSPGSSEKRVFQSLEDDCASSQAGITGTQVPHFSVPEEMIGMEDLEKQ